MSDIKQKIENGEGMLLLEKEGWVKAKYYDEKTDKTKNSKDLEYWQSLKILEKPIKNDYNLIDGELILKTDQEKEIEQILKRQQQITKQKGANISNIIFTDDEIKNFGDYISEIAKGNLEVISPEFNENTKKMFNI